MQTINEKVKIVLINSLFTYATTVKKIKNARLVKIMISV